jgi:PhnB protein
MTTLNPYLNFNGNTEEAFTFYKSVFGGEFSNITRFKDMPNIPNVPPADANKIMHIALPIGKGNTLMATDALESMGQKLAAGDNFSLSMSVDSPAEADKLFNALSAGGKVEMPIGDAPWGSYFGMAKDKFGIRWMVNYDKPKTK